MTPGRRRATVVLERRPVWAVRLSLSATRWVLYLLAAVCIAATVRTDFSSRAASRTVVVIRSSSDEAERYLALRFARAYLSWTQDPAVQEAAVSPFTSAAALPDAGFTPAPGSSEQVAWLAVAAEHQETGGVRDYTIAAEAGGTVHYIAVAVWEGGKGGGYALARYPALIAAPSVVPATALGSPALPAARNAAVVAVLDRALRNYVDGSAVNLAADLARGAVVTTIAPGLVLQSVQKLAVETSRVVLATVTVRDMRGDTFTLDYEVAVAEVAGRWEITQIRP